VNQQAVQYMVDGIGVIRGADLDFGQGISSPCSVCDEMVDMSSPITVTITEADGSETSEEMSEANARVLIAQVGLPPLPVICNKHPEYDEPGL